jgi:hypothetical protein
MRRSEAVSASERCQNQGSSVYVGLSDEDVFWPSTSPCLLAMVQLHQHDLKEAKFPVLSKQFSPREPAATAWLLPAMGRFQC